MTDRRRSDDNGHSRGHRSSSSSSSKRSRRGQNELIWVQPRTVPANLHKNSRRLVSPEAPTIQRRDSVKQHSPTKHSTNNLRTPPTVARDISNWKLDAELLGLTGSSPDDSLTKSGLIDAQNFMDCFTNMTDSTPLITPHSLDGASYLDNAYASCQMASLTDDDTGGSDKSGSSGAMLPDPRLSLMTLNGFSAIHLAAHLGNIAMVQLLFSACPEDADLLTQDSQTPLHIAAGEGHIEVTRELLRLGANALLQDNQGRTPLHLAVEAGHADIARLLLDGAQGSQIVCTADGEGKMPLHHAVVSGQGHIAQMLLERGADPRAPIR